MIITIIKVKDSRSPSHQVCNEAPPWWSPCSILRERPPRVGRWRKLPWFLRWQMLSGSHPQRKFSRLNFKVLTRYRTIKEFPSQPTIAFVLCSVSMSVTDGLSWETVSIVVRLAVKLAETTRITTNHGAKTNRVKLHFRVSPAHM